MSIPTYTCCESHDTTSPPTCSASSIASWVLPAPVGPTITTRRGAAIAPSVPLDHRLFHRSDHRWKAGVTVGCPRTSVEASPVSHRLTAEATRELGDAEPEQDRAAVAAGLAEVDRVHRGEQRARLVLAEQIAGADHGVTRDRREQILVVRRRL